MISLRFLRAERAHPMPFRIVLLRRCYGLTSPDAAALLVALIWWERTQ